MLWDLDAWPLDPSGSREIIQGFLSQYKQHQKTALKNMKGNMAEVKEMANIVISCCVQKTVCLNNPCGRKNNILCEQQ